MDFELRGELTVIIAPAGEAGDTSEADILRMLEEENEAGGKPKEIARRVAARATGWTAKQVYATMPSR